jgi:hypothetical protein
MIPTNPLRLGNRAPVARGLAPVGLRSGPKPATALYQIDL